MTQLAVSKPKRSAAELAAQCGTDIDAIQHEIATLRRAEAELDKEIVQTQYVRGCRQVAVQTDAAVGV